MASYTIQTIEESKTQGKFVFTPLQNRFGTTMGNALRRVLLSSLPGGSVFSIRIDGIYHEFTGVEGVKEDAATIILNIKQLLLKIDINDNDVYTLRINKSGPCVVTAADIECPTGVDVLNPDLVICTLAQGATFNMEMQARLGRGFKRADVNKHLYQNDGQPLGIIYTDSLYSPVKKVSYSVDVNADDTETLTMVIDTDGRLMPSEALSIGSKILRDHFAILKDIDEAKLEHIDETENETEEDTNSIQHKMIEDLELSVRSYNCLKRAGITTVEELTQKTEEEMIHVRNLGKKSLKEVKDKIYSLGLSFKSSNE
ncbi:MULTISPECIES: DNA-directed RNA polymerase subunit alpha [Faecalicoccus]|uniref:DNA-directed RNA polymerase subunit alpha n=1 Tax=Faecalicoccus pleomorphus TaxID=1323 RepID=A0A3E3E3K6_9FIRM|nr:MULTISPECIES: DNA-directed RNA polymerase subunit alpha [Faecalicoccus]MDB7985633.1 DNA-directed RNA polymerase subunit alpha [Faecalicoccus pleomorphus]MDB7988402.1 DNA-directed RNA polymerase subunit alpha [Faecalicoccus pleomorphus]MDB7994453.1 DNA-directed RNA polymerase subunit alpha [Faecalicoccus pleomorphus]MDY5110942.1 DNA-directed RNA polymerase subunit alpha [Faecalicoccus sp.]NME45369.1 DNA-directed RNA polymerase subunit alpha [Faecalicoccus pleomorphus]